MSKNSKTQSVTMLGGHNVAPPLPKPSKTKPPKEPEPEPEKPPAAETPAETTE
ncbi:hypothetical protein ES705_20282 [subsurface metagenome]